MIMEQQANINDNSNIVQSFHYNHGNNTITRLQSDRHDFATGNLLGLVILGGLIFENHGSIRAPAAVKRSPNLRRVSTE